MASSTAPRIVAHPPPLYIPHESSPTQGHNAENPFRDSVGAQSDMYQIPITPAKGFNAPDPDSPTNRSHFSPDTPSLEKGLGRRLRLQKSIGSRFMRSVSSRRMRREPESIGDITVPGGQTHINWILWTIVLVMLFFITANVIYLDVRVMSTDPLTTPGDLSAIAALAAPAVSSGAPTHSATPAASPRSNTVNLQNRTGSAKFSALATTCISNFPSNAATDVVGFCNRCFAELQAIPASVFDSQAPDSQKSSQAINDAVVLCRESGFAASA